MRIGYGHKEITVNLWICPDSGDADISLSKSAMHQLGFQLVDLYGESIWDTDGEPQAKVQINYGESFATPLKVTLVRATNLQMKKNQRH